MSDPNFTPEITSPTLPANSGFVHSVKEFSDTLTLDLTDDEITQAFKILMGVIQRWQNIFRSKIDPSNVTTYRDVEQIMSDVDKFEAEVKERLAESLHILASVDVMPVLDGTGYPTIVLEGALPSHYTATYGFDHERKGWEVKKAKEKSQVFLGVDQVG